MTAVVLVAAGVVLGPRDSAPGGAATEPSTVAAPAPPPETDSFGWDPCGYLSPDLYADVADSEPTTGRPRIQINAISFGSCEVHIALPGEPYQEMLIGSHIHQTPPDAGAYDDPERFEVTSHGEWTLVAQREPSQNSCLRSVYSDRSRVVITTYQFPDRRPIAVGLCELVDRASTALLDALRAGTISRMSLPSNSLGIIDTCELLSDAEVTGVVPLAGWTPPADRHRSHTCLRKSPLATPRTDLPPGFSLGADYDLVEVRTEAEQRPLRSSERNTFVSVAGRDTVFRAEGPGTCAAVTEGRNQQPWPGRQVFDSRNGPPVAAVETITVSVILTQRSGQDACRAAQTLAALVWSRLP